MTFDPERELPEALMTRFYINGGWRAPISTRKVALVSPVDGSTIALQPLGVADDMDAAVAAAREAFDHGPWPRLSPKERGDYVRRLGELCSMNIDLLTRTWVGQVGAPISLAQGAIQMVPYIFSIFSGLAESFEWDSPRQLLTGGARVVQEPVGVCALIVPWNNPLGILSGKVAAALTAGCTMVVKPSPETPYDAMLLAHFADEVGIPRGVINVVTGDRETGAYLVAHPQIDKVSFTGSTAAGKLIAQVCGSKMARVSLELGGKSAAIVLKDAKLEEVLAAVMPWAMPMAGQACLALTRVLVHRSRADEVTNALVGAVGQLRVGDPWDPQTDMGPVVNQNQINRVMGYISKGLEEGADLLLGGERDNRFPDGYFVKPTVFGNVRPSMTIAQEEIFGPVMSIIPFDDEQEAIQIANGTDYGLHGAVFSADAARAEAVARRVHTGSIGINTFNLDPAAPFGGFKCSGVGREGGQEGLRSFLEPKTLYLREPAIAAA